MGPRSVGRGRLGTRSGQVEIQDGVGQIVEGGAFEIGHYGDRKLTVRHELERCAASSLPAGMSDDAMPLQFPDRPAQSISGAVVLNGEWFPHCFQGGHRYQLARRDCGGKTNQVFGGTEPAASGEPVARIEEGSVLEGAFVRLLVTAGAMGMILPGSSGWVAVIAAGPNTAFAYSWRTARATRLRSRSQPRRSRSWNIAFFRRARRVAGRCRSSGRHHRG